jgi:hypothetical protein
MTLGPLGGARDKGLQMADHFDHITKAAQALNGPIGTPRERLIKAGNEFWAGLIHPDHWPLDLWEKAWRICDTLMAEGRVESTVAVMDSQTASQVAQQIAKELAELAADVEQARREGRIPPQSLN